MEVDYIGGKNEFKFQDSLGEDSLLWGGHLTFLGENSGFRWKIATELTLVRKNCELACKNKSIGEDDEGERTLNQRLTDLKSLDSRHSPRSAGN